MKLNPLVELVVESVRVSHAAMPNKEGDVVIPLGIYRKFASAVEAALAIQKPQVDLERESDMSLAG